MGWHKFRSRKLACPVNMSGITRRDNYARSSIISYGNDGVQVWVGESSMLIYAIVLEAIKLRLGGDFIHNGFLNIPLFCPNFIHLKMKFNFLNLLTSAYKDFRTVMRSE